MKRIGTCIVAILLGIGIGGISALKMTGMMSDAALDQSSNINIDHWVSNWSFGDATANPYLRAHVAKHGLFALAKSEAVYFMRNLDDGGKPLRGDCNYELSGQGQTANWWSITLYDQDSRLPMNEDWALSFDATQVGDAGSWTAQISQNRPANTGSEGEFWLSSKNATTFDLTLRLYLPDTNIIKAPEKFLNPPKIRKISCQAGEPS